MAHALEQPSHLGKATKFLRLSAIYIEAEFGLLRLPSSLSLQEQTHLNHWRAKLQAKIILVLYL